MCLQATQPILHVAEILRTIEEWLHVHVMTEMLVLAFLKSMQAVVEEQEALKVHTTCLHKAVAMGRLMTKIVGFVAEA